MTRDVAAQAVHERLEHAVSSMPAFDVDAGWAALASQLDEQRLADSPNDETSTRFWASAPLRQLAIDALPSRLLWEPSRLVRASAHSTPAGLDALPSRLATLKLLQRFSELLHTRIIKASPRRLHLSSRFFG